MKFEDYKYTRPNLEEIKKKYSQLLLKLKEAENFSNFKIILFKIQKLRNNFETMSTLVNIRYKINTKDKFYSSEREFLDKISPSIEGIDRDFFEIIISSKFKEDFKKKYGRNIIEKMELSTKITLPEITPLLERENKLSSEYVKLVGSAQLSFKNKKMNLSQVGSYFESKDRNIRKEANEVYWKFFSDNVERFDDIYDKLVEIRNEIAVELGYEDFIGLAYDRWGRNDFDKNNVKQLRENLLKIFLPLTKKVREWQKENLKLDHLKYYDRSVFINEELKPKGNTLLKIKNAREMFSEMGKETKEFFNYMADNNLLDLVPREGKAIGGFCEFIKNEKAPFIFMNFNDTPNDIITLVHESGHAFTDYRNKDKPLPESSFMGHEVAEIHSMSMEFFSWPWEKAFFEDENKFKLVHLVKSILFIPYGLLVDEFQHWIYENPTSDPKERRSMWREMEKKYLPDIDYEENNFLENGGYWFKQLHLFEVPFYYIDYVIAQLCAFQYLIKSEENFNKSWKEYIALVDSSINKSFLESIKAGNLKNPFEKENVESITLDIETLFNKLRNKVYNT